jgi:dynein heavy chain
MKALIRINKPTLVYGMSGCGKTQLIKGILKSLDPEKFTFTVINFN